MKLIVVTTPTFSSLKKIRLLPLFSKRDWIFYISENLRHQPCIPERLLTLIPENIIAASLHMSTSI